MTEQDALIGSLNLFLLMIDKPIDSRNPISPFPHVVHHLSPTTAAFARHLSSILPRVLPPQQTSFRSNSPCTLQLRHAIRLAQTFAQLVYLVSIPHQHICLLYTSDAADE